MTKIKERDYSVRQGRETFVQRYIYDPPKSNEKGVSAARHIELGDVFKGCMLGGAILLLGGGFGTWVIFYLIESGMGTAEVTDIVFLATSLSAVIGAVIGGLSVRAWWK